MRFLFLMFALFLFSCGSTKNLQKSKEASIGVYDEDLNPYRPSYETEKVVVVETKPVPSVPVNEKVTLVSDTEKVNEILSNLAIRNKKLSNGNGFRIILYVGNVKDEFQSAKSYVYRNFPEIQVYESYSQPTYRLKVGDFLSRDDAQEYLDQIKQNYYSARIIADRINPKK